MTSRVSYFTTHPQSFAQKLDEIVIVDNMRHQKQWSDNDQRMLDHLVSTRLAYTVPKSRICRQFYSDFTCPFGDQCWLAHAQDELRLIKCPHKQCNKMHAFDPCPFQHRRSDTKFETIPQYMQRQVLKKKFPLHNIEIPAPKVQTQPHTASLLYAPRYQGGRDEPRATHASSRHNNAIM